MNRVVLPIGIGVSAIAAVAVTAWFASTDNDDSGAEVAVAVVPSPTPGILLAGWNEGTFLSRHGSVASIELKPGAVIEVDLAQTVVFDCRSDCLQDVHDQLPPVTAADRICLYSEAGRGVLKFWIDRPSCPVLSPPR